jgi:transposase
MAEINQGIRIQALAYLAINMPISQIMALLPTIKSKSTIYKWQRKAIERGYNPGQSKEILLEYVTDTPRPGRPSKISHEVKDRIIKIITQNYTSRSFPAREIGIQASLSNRTIQRFLKRRGYRKVKPTVKPSLTATMMEARYHFAMRYKDWTLDDWMNIIWSDETSVVLGHRRGGDRV